MLWRVRLVLEQLPPEQRKVLDLAFFDGLTHIEIAERTGDPLGTVKTRIRLALKAMREAFTPSADYYCRRNHGVEPEGQSERPATLTDNSAGDVQRLQQTVVAQANELATLRTEERKARQVLDALTDRTALRVTLTKPNAKAVP